MALQFVKTAYFLFRERHFLGVFQNTHNNYFLYMFQIILSDITILGDTVAQ